jgi:Outer membrane protein beta-barrel domain
MKKIIFTILIVIQAILANGQVKFAAGIKGGLNFSKLDVNNISTSGKTGYHAGAFALFRFAKIGIQPEVILSQQGSTVNLDEWELSYINIPLILKIYLAAGVNLQLGPQFGFVNKQELDGIGGADLVKSSDISAGLGLGWDAPFGLTADARYNIGITDNSSGSTTNAVKNQVFQLSIGFKIIRLGKK